MKKRQQTEEETPAMPHWLYQLAEQNRALRQPTLRKSAGRDFARGAQAGHMRARLLRIQGQSKTERPSAGFGIITPEAAERHLESEKRVFEQITRRMRAAIPRAARQFFRREVIVLNRRQGSKVHDRLTADIEEILFWNSTTIDALRTARKIADFVWETLSSQSGSSRVTQAILPGRIRKKFANVLNGIFP